MGLRLKLIWDGVTKRLVKTVRIDCMFGFVYSDPCSVLFCHFQSVVFRPELFIIFLLPFNHPGTLTLMRLSVCSASKYNIIGGL